ncbi:MAG TPA: cytochrome c oxidase subunit II [Caulobacteraceae bacterium]|jgi:cytochrome c oxidase subunit 2|nr:cytochrome c oxidase subunit II [Caulobacteraceae bacterium]
MSSEPKGIWRRLAVAGAALTVIATSAIADIVGQPVDRGIDMQPAASHIRAEQIVFNNYILTPIIVAIAGFVLVMLAVIIVRFNKRANPTPATFSHNTPVEIIWTVVPVMILMFIAIFSFRLLFEEHDMPRPYMTVKVTGRQWNWDYEYPDQKISAYTSTPMDEAVAKARDLPYLLETNAPMVVPVNQVVRVQVTAEDVIHSWSVPAFGVKIDAIPGRLNQTWFQADRTGTFYGQCSQLCGANHSYMPIEVKVLSQADFDAWAASKQPKPAVTVASVAPTPVAAAAASPAAPPAAAAAH